MLVAIPEMILQLQKIETTAENDRLMPGTPSAEPAMIAAPLNTSALPSCQATSRRLRAWLILANIAAWIVVIMIVRLLFF